MKSSHVFWKNLALLLTSLVLCISISEFIIRNFIPIRNIGPSFTIYNPFYGKALKKSFSTLRITPEFTMRLTTNSRGFRGPEQKIISSRPILFLGDSFTMGYGVNDSEEFPALVRKAMKKRGSKVSVINAGMGDNGNGRWLKFLQAEGKKYNPGLVVLQIHPNDFQDNIRERLFRQSSAGELIELPVPSQGTMRMIQSLVEGVPGLANSYLIGLARQIMLLSRQVSWPNDPPYRNANTESLSVDSNRTLLEEQLLFHILEEVLTICKDQGWKVLAVLADIPTKRLAELKKFFLSHDVLMAVIPTKRNRPDLYYKIDGHWNASGHRFAADQTLKTMATGDFNFQ